MITKVSIKEGALKQLANLLASAKVSTQTIETVQSNLGASCGRLRLSFLSSLMSSSSRGRFRARKSRATDKETEKLNRDICELARICSIACDPCNYPLEQLKKLEHALNLAKAESNNYTKLVACRAFGSAVYN